MLIPLKMQPSPRESLEMPVDAAAALDDTKREIAKSELDPSAEFNEPTCMGKGPLRFQLPIRLSDQKRVLEGLDRLYDATEHPMLDTKHMYGRGSARAPEGEVEPSIEDANEILRKHIQDRQPYVTLAHNRLQNVVGLTDEKVFDLPFHHSPKPTPPANLARFAPFRQQQGNQHMSALPGSRAAPDGMSQVDAGTGRGLREWLLGMGRASGRRRRQECTSISFHDCTPDATGSFSNQLIAHFAAGELGTKIEVHEVELPMRVLDRATGVEKKGYEQWLWVLISKPLVHITAEDGITVPFWFLQEAREANLNLQDERLKRSRSAPLQPAPKFPSPVPTSWVVFACPGLNVTAYPSTIDTSHIVSPPETPEAPVYALNNGHNPDRIGKKIYKRKNYDFSHQGVPMFEFSGGKEDFFVWPDRAPRFLSVDGIGPFHVGDFEVLRNEQLILAAGRWAHNKVSSMTAQQVEEEQNRGRDRLHEVPGKYHGVWWNRFTEGAYQDATRWKWIQKAMVGGNCRVVVRWTEVETASDAVHGKGIKVKNKARTSSMGSAVENGQGRVGLGLMIGDDQAAPSSKKRKVSKEGRSVALAETEMDDKENTDPNVAGGDGGGDGAQGAAVPHAIASNTTVDMPLRQLRRSHSRRGRGGKHQ